MGERLRRILEAFGLSEYESRAYAALIFRGISTASELSDVSGVPYTRMYDVLSGLESKGLVTRIPGRPMRFRAVHPSVAVRNLKARIMSEFERRMRELDELEKELVAEAAPLYEKARIRVSEEVQVLRGRVSVHGMISTMLSERGDAVVVSSPTSLLRILRMNGPDIARLGGTLYALLLGNGEVPGDLPGNVRIIGRLDSGQRTINLLVAGDCVMFFDAVPDDLEETSDYDVGIMLRNSKVAALLRLLIMGFGGWAGARS